MNNQNENDKRTIQFGNSLNPNLKNNVNQPNMDMQNVAIPSNQNYYQQPIMNNQQISNQNNYNSTINQSYEQPNIINNPQQESLNSNVISNEKFNNNENRTKKNNTKLIIIIIVSVIAIFGLIRMVGIFLSYQGINSVLDNTRASTFVSDAESYVSYARILFWSDDMNSLIGGKSSYAPSCSNDGNNVSKITLNEIASNISGTSTVSPFGGNYDLNSSYVMVRANSSCEFEYSIYLTDGTYSIGTSTNPVLSDDLSVSSVKK